jgi:hypothetical protein
VEEAINLDGIRMNAVKTAPNGVINHETFFTFEQNGERVKAEYAGGRITQGYLVGFLKKGELTFRYCQMETDGALNGGESVCEVKRSNDLIQLIEHFQWESQEGGGTNIIQEYLADE